MLYKTVLLGGILFLLINTACQPTPSGKTPETQNVTASDSIGPEHKKLSSPETAGDRADTALARVLLQIAGYHLDSTHYQKALVKAQQALDIYRNTVGVPDTLIAKAYTVEGDIFLESGQLQQAANSARKALEICNGAAGERSAASANALRILGTVSAMKEAYQPALNYFEKSLHIQTALFGRENTRLRSIHMGLGNVYSRLNKDDKALFHYRNALEKGITQFGENSEFVAKVYSNMGVLHSNKGNFQQAERLYQKALEIKISVFGEKHRSTAVTRHLIGNFYLNYGFYDNAEECFQHALPVYLRTIGQNHLYTANLYHSIAVACELKADYDNALADYGKSIEIYSELFGEDYHAIARAYNNIGNIHLEREAFHQALTYYRKSLALALKQVGKYNPRIAEAYHNMGNAFLGMSKYREAASYYLKAIDIYNVTPGEPPPEAAMSHNNLGTAYLHEKKYEPALQSFRQARDIFINFSGESYHSLHLPYANMALVYQELHDHERALAYLHRALNIQKRHYGAGHYMVADNLLDVGLIYTEQSNFSAAYRYLDEAAAILNYQHTGPYAFDQVIHLPTLSKLLSARERLYQHLFEHTSRSDYLDSLHRHYRVMLALEDYLQQEYTGADTRRVHAAGAFPVYEGAIANLLVRKRPEELPETFRLAEKTKSRQLAEKIQSAAYSASFGIPGSLREKEHGLNVDIAYYEKKAFIEKHETETPDDSLLNYYNEKIFDLRREREALLKTFKTQFPDYYRLRYAPQVIDMAGVQKELLKKNKQALVEYFAGDSAIYAFIVLPDTFHIHEIVLDFPLEQWVNEFRCGLFAGYLTETACDSLSKPAGQALYARRAHQLYQKLFAPVDTLLPENAEVLLVPDGPLGYLPFEALLTRPAAEDDGFYRYSYLLRKHLISYAYSATLQHEMRYRQHRQPAGKDLIAFAPAFDEKEAADSNLLATRFIDPGLQRNRLSPLRYNRAEAEAVVAIFGGQVLCGTDATEAAFRQQAGDYRILHLATHSKVNDRAGDYSFLAFQTLDDSLENEWLYNSELYNLQLNADLVVLSACETGIGELQRGEGLISLARGFSYAGAKSIVTSLWNVSDQHTRDLMTSFYTYLKEGLPKHKALRQAKLDYLDEHEGPARSPFFWAGFVPIGDTAPVTTGRDGYWTALAALGACLLVSGLLWRQIAAG